VAEETTTETVIGPHQATELIEADALVIDVRRPSEWSAGHIPGASNIEMNDLTSSTDSVPRDRAVIFYCRSGNRSAMAAAAFRAAGWNAYHLEGGLSGWVDEGQGLEPPEGEVAQPAPGS
jgi:rhodanese-related sulfurtransferase